MFGILTRTTCPIGIDLSYDCLKMAQLTGKGQGPAVVDCKSVLCPSSIPPRSPQWQRWAIEAIRNTCGSGRFRGRDVVAALPDTEILIDHVRNPKTSEGSLDEAVISKIKHRVPSECSLEDLVIKCVPTEQDYVLVIAAEHTTIDRHLAIYERAGLGVKSIAIWPMAMVSCYARLFANPETDQDSVVMLLDIQSDHCNMVVCRGQNLLFAHSVAIGVRHLHESEAASKLAWELGACKHEFITLYKDIQIERLIFLSGAPVDPEVYRTIGAQLAVRAQLGDCWVALGFETSRDANAEGDATQTSWALALGLSLS